MLTVNGEVFSPPSAVSERARTILLIEDSMAVGAVLQSRLEAEIDAHVIHCTRFSEARRLVDAGGIAVAITGLSLPDADGEQILSFLVAAETPVIVFTAHEDAEAESHSIDRHLIDYIVKDGPAALDRTVRTAKRIIENHTFTILVVDDTRSARSGLVDILRRHNFRVFDARSGTDALKIMATCGQVDLVVTDYHMPDMDGYQLIQKIRMEKSSEELRIIGISSSSDRRLSALFLKAGASDFIYRPVLAEELQCRIDNNVETLKQLRRLKYFAERDPLTSLSNRRHFFEVGLKRVRENERNGLPSAVAILDIDHFKKVNDTLGHEAGDTVLKAVATTLATRVAGTDHQVGRLGGEEFALYLHGLCGRSAYEFCDELRHTIEGLTIDVHGKPIGVTTSIGVADVQPEESFDNHLNAADQFLYMAKNGGRNRVMCEGLLTGAF